VTAPSSWYTSSYSSSCNDSLNTSLAGGIVAAIIIGVLFLVVLPAALIIAVCCCGVALCGYKRQQPGGVVVLQQGVPYPPQPGMVYPQPYPQQAFVPGQAYPQAVPMAVPVSYSPSPVQYADNRMARSGTSV
jgi:hypothetical protein